MARLRTYELTRKQDRMLSLSVVGMLTLLISLVAISGVALVLFLARVVIGD